MEDQSFSSKTVIITGAAAGIGRATALRFARPRRSKREILSIRTPARPTLAVLAESDLAIVRAVKADHPDVRAALVILRIDG